MLLRQKISLLNKEDIHDIQPSVWCTLLELISFVAIVFDFRASSWLVQVCPNVFITNEPFVARYHNPENCCQNVSTKDQSRCVSIYFSSAFELHEILQKITIKYDIKYVSIN